MKKIIILLLTILHYSIGSAQNPAIQWQKTLGGTSNENAYSIQQTADGGYIVAGTSNSTDGDVIENHGGIDYWIVKLTTTGNIQWQKSLGGSGDDRAFSIKQTSDGGYIVAGNSNSTDGDISGNHGSYDCWIVKLTTSGAIQWQKALGGTSHEDAYSIRQHPILPIIHLSLNNRNIQNIFISSLRDFFDVKHSSTNMLSLTGQ